jgi:hypothetical protein
MKPVTALTTQNASNMRSTGQIPLRFLHSQSANFTLPIQKKPMATSLLPFSLKKTSLILPKGAKHGSDKLQYR